MRVVLRDHIHSRVVAAQPVDLTNIGIAANVVAVGWIAVDTAAVIL